MATNLTINQTLQIIQQLTAVDSVFLKTANAIKQAATQPRFDSNPIVLGNKYENSDTGTYEYVNNYDGYANQQNLYKSWSFTSDRFDGDQDSSILVNFNAQEPTADSDRDDDARWTQYSNNLQFLVNLRDEVTQSLSATLSTYSDLFVHVGALQSQTIKSYIESIVPSIKKRFRNLIDISDQTVNDILGTPGIQTANTLSQAFGYDILANTDKVFYSLQFAAAQDSEDPFYGAKHGLNIGQVMGNYFAIQVPGFYQNTNSFSFSQLFKGLSKDTANGPQPFIDDRINWFLPYANPAIYTLDERLQYTFRLKSSQADFTTLLTDLWDWRQNGFQTDNIDTTDSIGTAITFARQTLTNITGGALTNIGGLSDGLFPIQTPSLTSSTNIGTLLNSYLPDQATTKDPNVWDKTIDLLLQGGAEQYGPLIPLEFHRDYVQNLPAGHINGSWFIVNNEKEIEADGNKFISSLANELYYGLTYPNIKQSFYSTIIGEKNLALKDGLIFEGMQQVDGSMEGVTYANSNSSSGDGNPSQPQNAFANLTHYSYLNHVKTTKIQDILNEPYDEPRNWETQSAGQMASNEPQYFPFYFRTISRDEYAIIQQPYYDNNAVFMSKQRVTGQSIVFLECAIDDISEGFQSSITKERYLGRTEDVLYYAGTTRNFSISFNLPVWQPQDVPEIKNKVNALIQMQYPQLLAIAEVGVLGYRRAPVVELRVGDMYLLYGMIESINVKWGGESKLWETIPGGRFLRGCKIDLQLAVINREQPGAHSDFYSPTFKPEVFSKASANNGKNSNNSSNNTTSSIVTPNAAQNVVSAIQNNNSVTIPKSISQTTAQVFNPNIFE